MKASPSPLYRTFATPTLGLAVALAYAQAPAGTRPVACFGSISGGRLVGVVVRFEQKAEADRATP